MKATVQGNENYTGLEKIVSFVIEEKSSEEDKPNTGDDSNISTPDKDENDNVIRPAILWNDGRTTKECDYLNNEIGKDKLTEYTANIAFAGFTAPKLL